MVGRDRIQRKTIVDVKDNENKHRRLIFIKLWNLIHIVHPTLHPETALDKTGEIQMKSESGTSLIFAPFYKRSGWPIELIPIASEAFERFKRGELTSEDYFFNNLRVGKVYSGLTAYLFI
jgi:hypothetical protein